METSAAEERNSDSPQRGKAATKYRFFASLRMACHREQKRRGSVFAPSEASHPERSEGFAFCAAYGTRVAL